MRPWDVIRYFLREAWTSLRRSWRVSALAVLTIAVSLYVGGLFLLVGHNLARASREWRSEARLVAYLQPGATTATAEALAVWARDRPGVSEVRVVSAEAAARRFAEAFPSLAAAIESEGGRGLPPSVELATAPAAGAAVIDALTRDLVERSEVDLVDDDRDWLARLDTVVLLTRTAGFFLGGLLLSAAVFTIYSVIRLTAYLYREEIEVMRLVGATELMIRGPFYLEGMIQGAVGGLVSLAALGATYALLRGAETAQTVVGRVLVGRFMPPGAVAGVLLLGAVAGLVGAALSVGRELARSGAAPEARRR